MISMTLVPPEELTDSDIRWLVKGCEGSHDGCTPLQQVDAALTGWAAIFRISGDAEGIVVMDYGRDRKNAVITALAGKGLLRHFDAVHKQILATAAAAGASKVSGYVTRVGLATLYKERTKAKMVPMFIEDVL
jgi:hypothetical protein